MSDRGSDRVSEIAGVGESVSSEVKGPKSYFPSIETKYGKPIDFWMLQLQSVRDHKHMEQVNFLKTEHGIGHGHANALVAVFRTENS